MKIDAKKTLFYGVPLAILVVANYAVGKYGVSRDTWYPAAIKTDACKKATYIMIGSSRVAAAVVPDPSIVNFGQGFSTTGEHLLGLRRIVDRDKNALRGKLVCIEAAGGVPEYAAYDSGGQWINPGSPSLIGKVVTRADLPLVWRSDASAENKWETTLRLYANKLALFRYKELVYTRFTLAGNKEVAKLTWPQAADTQADLASRGGIKTDAASKQAAIKYLDDYLASAESREILVTNWDDSCVAKIVQLVRANGGQVIFFQTPLDSKFQAFYDRPVQRENEATFKTYAAKWKTPIVVPDISFQEEDFPDMWHLSSDKAPLYTKALFDAISRTVSTSGGK